MHTAAQSGCLGSVTENRTKVFLNSTVSEFPRHKQTLLQELNRTPLS